MMILKTWGKEYKVTAKPARVMKALEVYAKKEMRQVRKSRPILANLVYFPDGRAAWTDSQTLVMMDGVHEETEKVLMDPWTGADDLDGVANYPDLELLLDRYGHGENIATFNVKELKPFMEAVNAAAEKQPVVLLLDGTARILEATPNDYKDSPYLASAGLSNQEIKAFPDNANAAGGTVSFGINPVKLVNALMFLHTIGVKKVDLEFTSPVRPILLKADGIKIMIAPVRTKY